jgi:ABC-type phosphate transport system auxiliary subunit
MFPEALAMTTDLSALKRIEELKTQIAKLEADAIRELRLKREALQAELQSVDAQLEALTGSQPETKSRKRAERGPARSLPLQELKDLLTNAPEKTVNIRKENLDLRNIKVLVEANPHLLKLGGNGPWPTVTLLK